MSTELLGLLVALAIGLVAWFAIVVPSERRYHERKLKLLQDRIERRRQESGSADGEPHGESRDDAG